jgi:hypothetical protein
MTALLRSAARSPISDEHLAVFAREDCAIAGTFPYFYGLLRSFRRFHRRRINAVFNEP